MSDENLNLKASMSFDASEFLKGIQQVTESLAALEEAQGNMGASDKGLQDIEKQAGGAASAIDTLQKQIRSGADTANTSQNKLNTSMQNGATLGMGLQYSMYNVSYAAAAMGAAMIAPAAAVIATAVSYQTSFTDVQRTFNATQAAAEGINLSQVRDQLVGLTETLPVAFDDLTKIATLGDQMNIDPSQIVNFTKVVSEFSATTGVAVDAAATDFARLGQIMNSGVPASAQTSYAQIGDMIFNLGLKSVATEAQIAGVAQQIAVTAKNAGFTSGQTLALSTAFASLGVQAESARGTSLRVFTDISSAINTGGKSLNQFADITGMSAAQFKQAWGTDASGTFTQFLKGLESTGNVDAALASLGITAVRDKQNIGLLANNIDLLTSAQDNAANSAGTLDKAMGPKLASVGAQVTEMGNTIKAIFDQIGGETEGPISSFLRGLEDMLKSIQEFESNPVAQWFTIVGLAVSGIVGIAALGAGAFLRLAGTMAAVQTASAGTSGAFGVLGEAVKIVTGQTRSHAAANGELAASQTTVAETAGVESAALGTVFAVNTEGVATTEAATVANTEQAASQTAVAGSASKMGTAMTVATGAAAGLVALKLTTVLEDWINKLDGVTTSAGKTAKALSSVGSAKPTDLLGSASNGFDNNFSAGGGLANMAEYAKSGSFVQGLSGSFLGIDPLTREANTQFNNIDTGLSGLVNQGDTKQAAAAFKQISDALEQEGVTVKQVKALFPQYADALDQAAASSKNASSSIAGTTSTAEDQQQVFTDLISSAFSTSEAYQTLGTDLDTLGKNIVNNGADVALSGSDMATVIQDIYSTSDGSADAANKLQGFFNALIAGGYASASQLANLQAVIAGLTDGKGAVDPAKFNLAPLTAGFNSATAAADKTAQKAQQAAKQVYTLVDYGNDLQSVFTRAFNIRYSSSDALDKISTDWQNIAATAATAQQAIASANTEISDANTKAQAAQATLAGLTQNRQVLLYWKSVADSYGDTLRSAALAAQLQQNTADTATSQSDLATANSDLAKGQTDLATAQDSASTSLDGNSKAAIANRAAIEGLLTDYSGLLTSYAQSGASQQQLTQYAAQLKQQFIQQATQAGFSRSSIENYSKSFDDMTAAIGRVPRNITVNANTNPALQALNEFIAKANASSANVNVGASGNDGALAGYNAGTAYGAAWANAVANARVIQSVPANVPGGTEYQMYINGVKTGNPFFADGGYVSGPGSGTSDSIAANLSNGEFVINAASVSRLGVPFLNALNGGRNFDRGTNHFATGGLVAAAAQQASNLVIAQLAPYDRAQMTQLISAVEAIPGLSAAGVSGTVDAVTRNSAARGRS